MPSASGRCGRAAMRRSRRWRSSWRASSSSLAGRGLELAGADDELGDEAGERLVARRELAGRGAQAAAQVLGGAARRRRGEELARGRRRRGAARPPRAARGSRPGTRARSARGGRAPCARRSTGAPSRVGSDRRPRRRGPQQRRRDQARRSARSRPATSWTSSSRSTLGGSGRSPPRRRRARGRARRCCAMSPRRARARPRSARAGPRASSSARIASAPSALDDVGRDRCPPAAGRSGTRRPRPARRALCARAARSMPRATASWPGRVGVLAEQRRRRQARQRVDLLLGQRRPHRADDLGHARLAQRDHVRVALDEHHPAGARRRRAREVGAVDASGPCGRPRCRRS